MMKTSWGVARAGADRAAIVLPLVRILALAHLFFTVLAGPVAAQTNAAHTNGIRLSSSNSVSHLLLTIDKSQTLRADRPFAEALVANPEIADVVPLTDQTVYVIGKKVGMTRMTMLDKDKRLLGIVEIEVSYDVKALREELRRSVPGGSFQLRTANGRLLLGGVVPDAPSLAKAVAITEQFTAACEAANVKELSSAAGSSQLATGAGSMAASSQNSKCFLNSLTVRAPQQVLLEVRFVEAQRTAARDLGFTWDIASGRIRGVSGGDVLPVLGPAGPLLGSSGFPSLARDFASNNTPFGTFVARILDNGTKADVLIQALEKRGLARRLAEPNLVTLSGDTANFLAGGEFPFPVAQNNSNGAATITLEFKKFGVGLAFTPTVLASGQINLKIEPEVSDLDFNHAFNFGSGITVPSLVVRRANTTVELRDGQSFAIAGLLQSTHKKNQSQVPWIGQVPVLGTLFRSASYEKDESDLVIIVTPHLVRPAIPGQPLATPLDQKLASNDRDFFVRGRQEIPKDHEGPYGHILDSHEGWSTSTKREARNGPLK